MPAAPRLALCLAVFSPLLCQAAPSLQQRIAAAQSTADSKTAGSACAAIDGLAGTGFYWEIGDRNGIVSDPSSGLVAAGTVHPVLSLAKKYTRDSSMLIASASKWVYGAYVAESQALPQNGAWVLPAAEVPFLNFTSGYDNMSARCPALITPTVADCLDQRTGLGLKASTNGARTAADIGRFDYNSGHLEVFEGGADPSIAGVMNGANADDTSLAAAIETSFAAKGVRMSLGFVTPVPAGGIQTTPADYAAFLQGLLRTDEPLLMSYLLRPSASDPYAVCTNPDNAACGAKAVYTPTPTGISWHYSITHWIEDDPVTGDGAYSSPGKFGFYPWIDASKTYYGILARYDDTPALSKQSAAYYKSAACGAAIRKAFISGAAQ
jgi:hypothetical protein